MVRSLTILFSVLILASCSKKVLTSTSEVKDSTHVEIKERIVNVPVPGETVYIKEIIECDSVTNKPKPVKFKARGTRAKATVTVRATGELEVSGGCDSLEMKLKAQDSLIFRLRYEKKSATVPVYTVRKIDRFCHWFTGLAIVLIIGKVVLKFRRFFGF